MSFFKVTVSGIETIDEDFELESRKIQAGIPQALNYVGSEMIVSLQKHIFEDWYEKYTPSVYERRTDDTSLGTPLGAEGNMDVFVDKDKMEFSYEPTGEHAKQSFHTRDGDRLIEFLQVGNKYMPPRPFWNLFVEEQKNRGIMEAFIKGMSPFATVIPEGFGKDVIFEGNESMLEGQTLIDFGSSADNELPF